jgi:hypothetical protein
MENVVMVEWYTMMNSPVCSVPCLLCDYDNRRGGGRSSPT